MTTSPVMSIPSGLLRRGRSGLGQELDVFTAGNGSGAVTSSPSGIACNPGCKASFSTGTVVTLTATPAVGSVFAGWSGACTGTGSCVVTMSQARSVIATFNLPTKQTLTVTKSTGGTVSSAPAGIACGTTCAHAYAYGTPVTLTAKRGLRLRVRRLVGSLHRYESDVSPLDDGRTRDEGDVWRAKAPYGRQDRDGRRNCQEHSGWYLVRVDVYSQVRAGVARDPHGNGEVGLGVRRLVGSLHGHR